MKARDVTRIGHDPAALETFYREHVGEIRDFIARRVGDPHLAADLTADVFLAAIDAADSYRPRRAAPRLWLFGIARNTVNAEFRRARREREAGARIEGRRLLDADDLERMQDRTEAAARSRELYAGLDALPDAERAVFELSALDELSPREAAAALGINPVTARVRLHRARAALRTQLSDEAPIPITRSMEA